MRGRPKKYENAPRKWRGEFGVQTELATNLQMRLLEATRIKCQKINLKRQEFAVEHPSKSRPSACRLRMDTNMKSEKAPPRPAIAAVKNPGIALSHNCGLSSGPGGVAIFDRPDDFSSFDDFLTEATRFGRRMRCPPMDAFDVDNPDDMIFLLAVNDNEAN